VCATPSPSDPIQDEEGILRRIPYTFWRADQSVPLQWQAFRPLTPKREELGNKGDVDGLSVSRQAITSASAVSQHPSGRKYHVARLVAIAIRAVNVTIKPDPQQHDQGHCLLPEINSADYLQPDLKTRIMEMAAQLAAACTIILEAL